MDDTESSGEFLLKMQVLCLLKNSDVHPGLEALPRFRSRLDLAYEKQKSQTNILYHCLKLGVNNV